jgi:chromosome segregation ATPase
MTTDQITLHLCEVIAEQKEKINQLESSNKYLRESKEQALDGMIELNAKISGLISKEIETNGELNFLNNQILEKNIQIAEQKETIETLQSSVQSMDLEYQKLAAEYNALS